MSPPAILPSRPACQLDDQWLRQLGEPAERGLHLRAILERMQPRGPAPQLTGGLRPTQQQHGQHRQLGLADPEVLLEALVELHHPGTRTGPHRPDQLAVPELLQRRLQQRVVVVGDRIAAARLVARGAQGVEGQRVARRDRALLLQQRAEHPLLDGGQLRSRLGHAESVVPATCTMIITGSGTGPARQRQHHRDGDPACWATVSSSGG
jgi:hypothetical protein